MCSGRDGVWIELTYTGGDNYTSHCDKRARMTRLAFLCDPNINGKVYPYNLLGGDVLWMFSRSYTYLYRVKWSFLRRIMLTRSVIISSISLVVLCVATSYLLATSYASCEHTINTHTCIYHCSRSLLLYT